MPIPRSSPYVCSRSVSDSCFESLGAIVSQSCPCPPNSHGTGVLSPQDLSGHPSSFAESKPATESDGPVDGRSTRRLPQPPSRQGGLGEGAPTSQHRLRQGPRACGIMYKLWHARSRGASDLVLEATQTGPVRFSSNPHQAPVLLPGSNASAVAHCMLGKL